MKFFDYIIIQKFLFMKFFIKKLKLMRSIKKNKKKR